MTIVNFTPWPALIGGALIGLAAAGMWWLLGRLAGVSSILGTAMISRGEMSMEPSTPCSASMLCGRVL